MYTYRGRVLHVVDGDTLHVEIDLGMDVKIRQTVRVYGIDTPEMSTPEGKSARARVLELMPEDSTVTINTVKDKREKYGRYLAEVWLTDGRSLGQVLLASGLAKEYYGGKKP